MPKKWEAHETPCQKALLNRFVYDPLTGKLFHREDPADDQFRSPKLKARYVERFGGKEAGTRKFHLKTKVPTGIYVRLYPKRHMAHRLIWVMAYGSIPTDKMIDHVNGNPFDNRLENLRLVGSAENQWNAKKAVHKSTGVYRRHNRFRVQVSINKCEIPLGTFTSLEEAQNVRLRHAHERKKKI
jgi:hypothetical protein